MLWRGTGRRSAWSFRYVVSRVSVWEWLASNQLPPACRASALPDELHSHVFWSEWRESNPQSSVPQTDGLPSSLHPDSGSGECRSHCDVLMKHIWVPDPRAVASVEGVEPPLCSLRRRVPYPARRHRHENLWYPRRESNPQHLVPKTSALIR